ncbi:MAG: acetyl esterase/lipase [Candidatus Azotimanducaceae bacterium]
MHGLVERVYCTEKARVNLLSAVFTSLYQSLGLGLLNFLAKLGPYSRREVSYGSAPTARIDWYVRDGQGGSGAPTVIFFYGGNWRLYKKRDYSFVADTLVSMGLNVAIPEFPKYPNARFEEILSDAVSATRYVLDHLAAPGPVFLMGHSSGAQIAASIALNESLLGDTKDISAMVGLSGPYDFYPFTEDDHWDLFGPEALYPLSQPVNFVRANAPELYLLHGAEDTRVRRGHSKSLMEKQRAAGGKASREVYEGMGHGDAVISFSRIHRRNSPLIRDIQTFINTQLEHRLEHHSQKED